MPARLSPVALQDATIASDVSRSSAVTLPFTQLRRYARGETIAPHIHSDADFTVVLSGGYRETMRKVESAYSPGSMLFYPAHEEHAQQIGADGAAKLVFRTPLQDLGDVHLFKAPMSVRSPDALVLARRVLNELRINDAQSGLAAGGLLLELIALFARARRRDWQPSPPLWLRRAKDMLTERSCDTITLTNLARAVDRHPVHLAREFRRYFGETAGAYQRRQRALRAATLLCTTTASVTEIAMICNYGSSSQFVRAFRAVHGTAPSAYREQHR